MTQVRPEASLLIATADRLHFKEAIIVRERRDPSRKLNE